MAVSPQSGLFAAALCVLVASAGSASASYPGRPGQIAFVSDESGSDDILVMNADGSGRESLTTGPDDDSEPVWSADGRKLAFVRSGVQPSIYVVRADGTGLRRVTAGASPSWSADGGRIVFARRAGRGADLYVGRADGRGQRRLTRTELVESEPEWSPDARLVAYVRTSRAGGSHLYVMRPDGRGVRRVTTGAVQDVSPTWSPDGKQLAFVRHDPALGTSSVYVTTLDGKRQRALARDLELDPAATLESDPAWAPDGKRIVFVRSAPLYSDLYVATADGKFLRRLTNNAAEQISDRQPGWQRLAKTAAAG